MVLAADDVGDLRFDIIQHAGQGVEEGAVLADQDRVGQGGGLDRDMPAHHVFPLDRIARQFETPMRLAALGLEGSLLGIGQVQGGAVIDRRPAIGHLQASLAIEILAGLITGIEQSLRFQRLGGGLIAVKPVRLFERLVPGNAQPGQVGADAVLIGLRRALDIGIVNAQHKGAAGLAREQIVEDRGADIADMKLAGRAGRKTDFGHRRGASQR